MDFLKKMMPGRKSDANPVPEKKEPARPNVLGGKNKKNDEARQAAGMKKGGKVKMKKGGVCR